MNEKWLPIVGWEGFYEVSDLGRVRSISLRNRHVANRPRERILKIFYDSAGRPRVGLCRNSKVKLQSVGIIYLTSPET